MNKLRLHIANNSNEPDALKAQISRCARTNLINDANDAKDCDKIILISSLTELSVVRLSNSIF